LAFAAAYCSALALSAASCSTLASSAASSKTRLFLIQGQAQHQFFPSQHELFHLIPFPKVSISILRLMLQQPEPL